MTFLIILLAVSLTGCGAMLGYKPEQLKELVKVKDSGGSCIHISNPVYGSLTAVWFDTDKGIYGGIKIKPGCEIESAIVEPAPRAR